MACRVFNGLAAGFAVAPVPYLAAAKPFDSVECVKRRCDCQFKL
jgi:hypothetical protein